MHSDGQISVAAKLSLDANKRPCTERANIERPDCGQ